VKAGWIEKSLGEICSIARGGSPRPIQAFLTRESDGINWVKISDATASGKYIYETAEKIKPSGAARSRIVKDGDFLLSNSMSFGRPYIMRTTGCVHDGWLVLSEYQESFNQDFLYHLLGSPQVFSQFDRLAAGSTVRNLNIELASKVIVPIPTLEEQRRIVTLLDEAFADIATAKANAEKNLQKARELFETHLRNQLNARSTNGVDTTLEKCCDQIFAGGDVPKDRVSNERTATYPVPIFSNGAKDDGLYGFTDTARVTKPSVTVSARGTLGFSAIRNEPFLPVVRLIVLTPNENLIDLSFLHYTVLGMDFENTGTSIPQLTVPNFKDLSIYLPPLAKQKELVLALDSIRDEIQNLEAIYRQKLTALDDLKKSLLHQTFSGQL
jgi:type I restriction enzyme S subunit